MFGFGKKSPKSTADAAADAAPDDSPGLFASLRQRLSKTRSELSKGLAALLSGRKTIDAELLDDIETQLIRADIGLEAADDLINDLTERTARRELSNPDALFATLQVRMTAMLGAVDAPLTLATERRPFVILMVGVNGAGKTTTIGKLAHRFKAQGQSVMLAAADTFRAAAVEQLTVWGERNGIPVIAQAAGADPASVAFDALNSARAKGVDVLLIDTAGRLHTQRHLMDELKKIKRVIGKLDDSAPHEVLLTLDAGTGQNALNQARQFHDAIGVTGINLTKLDGTAKGGVIFAIAKALNIPIRFIGVGEGIADLRPFNAAEFVAALFGDAVRE